MTIIIDVELSTDKEESVNIKYSWKELSPPSTEEKLCFYRIVTAVRDEIKKIGIDTLLNGGKATSLDEHGVDDRRIGF